MVIAIDGPAGSGKSTIAREVAGHLGLRYLDTGAMYRTVTLLALEAGLVPDRVAEAAALAETSPIKVMERTDDLSRVFVGDREVTDEIRGRLVSQNVSLVSADPGVRAVLTRHQRSEADRGDVVLEGRDMGTVVAPNADLKVYLTASLAERARRRQLQLQAQEMPQSIDQLRADIAARDAYDSGRPLAPLCKADDAVEIDTTGLTIDQVVGRVVEAARAAARASGPPRKWPLSRLVRGPLDTLLYRVAYLFLPPVCRLLFRMEIEGGEHFPLSGPVVLASNHRSNLDPFFLGVSSPRQIHFMAKAELWKVGALGRIISRMGSFPINRGEADRQAVRRAFDVLDAGAVLGIFPEGHRQRDGGLGEIRPGVALFSLRDKVVTIPVVMEGTERVVRGRLLRFPRVRVRFGVPLKVPEREVPRGQRALVASRHLADSFEQLLGIADETA